MQIEEILGGGDPFGGMPNIGFPGMGIPTIIIGRKNLKKNRGSPKINPINIFNELDEIFESFFDSIADSVINENSAAARHNSDNSSKIEVEDDHIELDQLDLSLNETEVQSENGQKSREGKRKENEAEKGKNGDGVSKEHNSDEESINELKVEDVVKMQKKERNNVEDAGKIEEYLIN